MFNLKFNHVNYEKYDNIKINIINGILVLKKHCEVLKIDKSKYDYQKVVVQLGQPDLCDLMKVWEVRVNEYLKGKGIPLIKILYGNKIYPNWLVVLGFNATLTAKVISWRSVTHMCFLAFSHQY